MKLNQQQYQYLSDYLISKGVLHIDLKYEILDHIVSGVENNIQNKGLYFQEAFELEKIKWQSELDSFKILRYNVDFRTPKIVLRRYWIVVKEMYIKAIIMTLGALLPLFLFLKWGMVPIQSFHTVFGYFYVVAFIGIVLAFLKIKTMDANTVDKIMFKATMCYFMVWLVVFNPIVTKLYWVYQEGLFMYVFFFIHVFLVCFSFNFIDLYKAHIKKVKLYSL